MPARVRVTGSSAGFVVAGWWRSLTVPGGIHALQAPPAAAVPATPSPPPQDTGAALRAPPNAAALNWWGLLCIPLVLMTSAGNILVCVAITGERRLQNMTNYFLMSLAITDLMVAVLVMPLGIVVLVLGYFPLPPIYCMLWTLLDVLFCTASIMHLCTLSVDRFFSLSFPMRFGRHKTRRRVLLKLVPVWLLSVCQSVPLCLIYARDHRAVLVDGVCGVPEPLFQLVGSVVCFYIPLLVMLVTYALTVRMLNRKQVELGSPRTVAATSAVRPLSRLWWRSLLDRLNPKCAMEEIECTDFSVCATSTSAYASLALAHGRRTMVRRVADDDGYGTFAVTGARPSLRAEQKATKVLGIIFFTFVLLWSPFFIINMLLPLCARCRHAITVDVINFVTWLGYISSLVNPIFYTLFNKTFRNAFLRILKCRRR
ncbi:5-hydroxytryptamine receptor 2A-like [Pollicipes pollicipes]|uniref:5-hydroxytryptamine receptor 2A-like n=1 Tax=Pollicipes pollicipes TaxID=41117 RepID=UPI001884FA68|nr:5-hydroxytryptamine receptor 2A-like [Pollicipes pollicipes]